MNPRGKVASDERSATAPSAGVDAPNSVMWAIRDSWNEATRHLRSIPRSPELLMFTVLQPVMFVLLFYYVFGGELTIQVGHERAVPRSRHPGADGRIRFVLHRSRVGRGHVEGLR